MSFDLAFAILLGALGLIAGSFIGLVSRRLPSERPIAMTRSRCEGCERPLMPWHLVPLVSYLAQGGRCRACGSAISIRYPLLETGCAVVGVWAALAFRTDPLTALATALLGWQLVLLAVVDGENFWLPDVLTLPLIAVGLIAAWRLAPETLVARLIGVALGFLLLWALAQAYRRLRGREGLGGGDPILFAGAGAWVGWTGLPTVLLWACAAGFSVVMTKLVLRRPVAATDRLPFGVFLAVGIWMTWLFGPFGL